MSAHVPTGETRGIYGFPGAKVRWMAFREVRIQNLTGAVDVEAELQEDGTLLLIISSPAPVSASG